MSKHIAACLWLLTATALWGLSFPVAKALGLKQQVLVPDASSIFIASIGLVVRFGVAALIVAAFCLRSLRQMARSEFKQGAGLAFFGGVGILLQMDGIAHTAASTSAFLTQFYCLVIPIWVAWRKRTWPSPRIVAASILVLTGVAVLARIEWPFTIGRGEAETLLGAVFFSGQILWLERAEFAQNRTMNFSFVMFLGTALLILPVAIVSAPYASAHARANADWSVAAMLALLIVCCTLGAYLLMNAWQKYVTATEAALIYCFEPLFASFFALFLPAWLSSFAELNYLNETLTGRLLVGGALILGANIFIQIQMTRRNPA